VTKEDRIYKVGIRKLYHEIDILEIVKQIRISRFMALLSLNANQREMIKFSRQYVLSSKRKNNTKTFQDNVSHTSHEWNPTEALLDFNPKNDEIDKKLYDNLVDDNERQDWSDNEGSDVSYLTPTNSPFTQAAKEHKASMREREAESDSDSVHSRSEEDDRDVRGGQTSNVDDFLTFWARTVSDAGNIDTVAKSGKNKDKKDSKKKSYRFSTKPTRRKSMLDVDNMKLLMTTTEADNTQRVRPSSRSPNFVHMSSPAIEQDFASQVIDTEGTHKSTVYEQVRRSMGSLNESDR